MGLRIDTRASYLEDNSKAKVAIARSLAINPNIMLFDEVTAALDPETVKERSSVLFVNSRKRT